MSEQILGLLQINNQYNVALGGYDLSPVLPVFATGCAACAIKYGLTFDAKPEVIAAATVVALPGQTIWLFAKRKQEEKIARQKAAKKQADEAVANEQAKNMDPRAAYQATQEKMASIDASQPTAHQPNGITQKTEGGIIVEKIKPLKPEELGDEPRD